MTEYKIIIEVWPYHGIPKGDVWPRIRDFLVEAGDFDEAVRFARVMQQALDSHGKTWKASIRTVTEWPMPNASQNEAECPEEWMKRHG